MLQAIAYIVNKSRGLGRWTNDFCPMGFYGKHRVSLCWYNLNKKLISKPSSISYSFIAVGRILDGREVMKSCYRERKIKGLWSCTEQKDGWSKNTAEFVFDKNLLRKLVTHSFKIFLTFWVVAMACTQP